MMHFTGTTLPKDLDTRKAVLDLLAKINALAETVNILPTEQPISPVVGQMYTDLAHIFVWNGSAWTAVN
jgi:hypothetical protein